MEHWVLLYLHDWDPSGKVYPEIHGIYDTWNEASNIRGVMCDPSKYWIRRVWRAV